MDLRAARLAMLLLFGALAAPASLPARAAAAGEPVVAVAPGAAADTVTIRASIDIAAARAKVWAIMTDCARAVRFVPGLTSCRVLERDPAGRWDIREHLVSWLWFLPNVRSVFRSDYEAPERLRFRRVSGTLSRNEGEWRLEAIDGGHATRGSYDATVSADVPVPQFIVEAALKRDIANVLRHLQSECTSAAEYRQAPPATASPAGTSAADRARGRTP
jgi:Polyketide cyclase / dehydrase and lipid transport